MGGLHSCQQLHVSASSSATLVIWWLLETCK